MQVLAVAFFAAIMTFSAVGFDFTNDGIYELAKERGSVDATIEHFPQELKDNHLHVPEPLGSLGGNYDHPRSIAFADEAKLAVSFTGLKGAKGYNTLKVRQFHDEGAWFDYRSIRFTANGVIRSESNPVGCMKCHDPSNKKRGFHDPIPLWDEYFIWRGCYGSYDDLIEEDKLSRAFLRFKELARTADRYRHLNWGNTDFFPYQSKGKYLEADDFNVHNRVNARYTNLISRLNAKRLARIITANDSRGVVGFKFLQRSSDTLIAESNTFDFLRKVGIQSDEVNLNRRSEDQQYRSKPGERMGSPFDYDEGQNKTTDRLPEEVARRLVESHPELLSYLNEARKQKEVELRDVPTSIHGFWDVLDLKRVKIKDVSFYNFVNNKVEELCQSATSCSCIQP